MDLLFVESSLDFLGKACEDHPLLRVKIAVDCVEKGYASHEQVADFLGLGLERWKQFYGNFQEGDIRRVPGDVRSLVPARDLRFLTGFSDEQLEILAKAIDMPLLFSEALDEAHPLLQELVVLLGLGIMLVSRHNQFRCFRPRVYW